MGCCVSVDDGEASELQKKKEKNGIFSHESRAPPPSAEEETVKEVLSETPKPNSKPEAVLVIAGGDVKQEVEEETKPVFATKIQENHLQLLHNHHRRHRLDHHPDDVEENVKRQELETNEENMSEVSEICSLSMSMSERSVSTTTVTDKRDNDDDEHEVRQQQQRVSRSPAKLPARNREYGVRRDRVAGQSPSRRSEQSPGKRSFNNNGSARMVKSSSRGGSIPDPIRKEPGECSGRRSRSPATTRSATMNRSPSTRRTNQSPGRVRTDPNESGSKKMEGFFGSHILPIKSQNVGISSLRWKLYMVSYFLWMMDS
ncbi:hypothetical protein Ddye_019353 [Dipteronia dyeriana]|uniref:Uncharacterized protein n=1 Tax=Dipteronia dyeriana TaxID=168575 RepID=A0AAD9TY87_9ROSI|nr:hypothetical protein Ddye_019353 [Dipteronia dyeriana]